MVKGVYSRIICNLKFSGGSKDLQYINSFLVDPEFGLMENLMLQMMGNLSQILKLSKGDHDTPTFTKAITGP